MADYANGFLKAAGTAVGSWSLAASTGAIAAWVLNWVRDWLNRPELEFALDGDAGSLVETDDNAGNKTKYARLIICNSGKTLAKNCSVAIDYFKRVDPSGSNYVFHTDWIDLNWSLQPTPVILFNVPSSARRFVDVGHTHLAKADFDTQQLHKSGFWIDGFLPNRLRQELKMNATYEMHVRAFADNASPRDYSCRIQVGNTFRDLTIEPCNDPRPN